MSIATPLEPLLDSRFLAALDRLSVAMRRPMRGQLLGARRSLRHGASVEFSDFRDYTSGDDLRTIDWKAYGRLDKLLVKLFREEDDLSLHLLLDASESMAFGGEDDKMLFAKKLCAALGAVALLDFDRCSLNVLSSARPSAAIGSQTMRGRSSLPILLSRIARTETAGQARIASSLAGLLQRRTSPGALVLVSDFYDHGLTSALLARASRTMDVALVHVVAPEEANPTLLMDAVDQRDGSGAVRFIDSETGEPIELTLGSEAAQRYSEEFTRFCDDLSAVARMAGTTYTRVITDTPVEEVVLGALRKQRIVQ